MDLIIKKGIFGSFFINMLVLFYLYMALVGVILSKGTAVGLVISGLMFALTIYYGFVSNMFRSIFGSIYFFILFVFFLILLTSSNYPFSYRMWLKMSMGLLALPLGFNIFHCEENLQRYWRNLVIIVHIYIVYIVLANLLHFGGGYGKEDLEFETGNLFAEALFSNVYILTMIPFFIRYNKSKAYTLLVMSIAAVLIIVNMKRTPIACGIISVMVMVSVLYYLNLKYGILKTGISSKKYVVAFMLLFGCAFLYFQDTIEMQIENREKRFQRGSMEKEGRVKELLYIYEEIVEYGDLRKMLFGKETFNIVGTYANGKFGNRQIHEDYGMLLHSTGIIGLAWYLGIQIFLLFLPYKRRYHVLFSHHQENRLLLATYTSLIIIHFVSMTSGVIRMSFSEMIYYMTLGLILRFFYEDYGDYLKSDNLNALDKQV